MMNEFIDVLNNIPDKERSLWTHLNNAGYESYLVGGAVRDILMGNTPSDYDFATIARPKEIINLFSGLGYAVKLIGESFGVVLVDGVEIATFRGDCYHGKGDKDVTITYLDSIEEDLSRRDFTINAMAMDINGNLLDPFYGNNDILNKIVRFVGDPDIRIKEDPNRIFRAFRFCARFDFILQFDSGVAIERNSCLVDMVACERIRLEIMKTMQTVKSASIFWELMRETGILDYVIPELADGYKHDHGNHHDEDIWTHNMAAGDNIECDKPLLKLAGYLHDVGKPASYDDKFGTFYEHQHFGADIARKRLSELKFSNDEIRYIVNIILVHMDGTRGMSNKARRRLKNKLNAYGLCWEDYVFMRIADRVANFSRPNFTSLQIQEYVDMFTIDEEVPFSVNDLVISGGEFIEVFNLESGPLVGKIQREVMKKVIDTDLDNEYTAIINFVEDEFRLKASIAM